MKRRTHALLDSLWKHNKILMLYYV